jgi:DNA repair helicase Rad25
VEKRALYDRLLDKRSLTEQSRLKAGTNNGYTNVSKTQQDLA